MSSATVERAGDTTDRGYTRLARFQSVSSPDKFYWVSADPHAAAGMSCQCRGWIHYKDCKHTKEVRRLLQSAGLSVQAAVDHLKAGGALVQGGAPQVGAGHVDLDHQIKAEAAEVCREYFGGNARPAPQHRALRDRIEAAIRKFAGQLAPSPAVASAAVASAFPDWLGGGRAIRIRD